MGQNDQRVLLLVFCLVKALFSQQSMCYTQAVLLLTKVQIMDIHSYQQTATGPVDLEVRVINSS